MKTGAEILGVSYGTLYGRYRETFGYLKHAWNAGGGRPTRPGASYGSPSMVKYYFNLTKNFDITYYVFILKYYYFSKSNIGTS